jgi:hypothetical protein
MIPLLLSGLAYAGPCDLPDTGVATGAVTAALYDGDLGVARRVCGRTEVALEGGGLAVVDTANFYGHIVAGGTVEGSWLANPKTELFASIEAFRYDSVITPIPATYMGFGHVGLGASERLFDNDTLAVAAHGRLVLPTAIGLYQHAYPLALDLGVGAEWAPVQVFHVHADLGGLGAAAISKGPALPGAGATATVGAEWRPGRHFALVLDGRAGFGYTAPVDVIAASLGVRVGVGKHFGIELDVTKPLAGRDRTLAAGELRAAYRF